MLNDALLIIRKDLTIELKSNVVLAQVGPFGILVLILFGLAIAPDLQLDERSSSVISLGGDSESVLTRIAPGLYWITVLLSALMAFSRSLAIESADGNLDALKMAGLEPAGVFIGKVAAVAMQLIVLQIVLGFGALILFGTPVGNLGLAMLLSILATVAICSVGVLYTALATGQKAGDTLVPLLVMPVLAPILLSATKATEKALFENIDQGWIWAILLAFLSLVYLAAGMLSFGAIMEEF